MGLDIRLPIGALFTMIGVLMAAYGLVSDRAIYQRSLGINVNLWWGLVLVAFGIFMLALARRRGRHAPPDAPEPASPASRRGH